MTSYVSNLRLCWKFVKYLMKYAWYCLRHILLRPLVCYSFMLMKVVFSLFYCLLLRSFSYIWYFFCLSHLLFVSLQLELKCLLYVTVIFIGRLGSANYIREQRQIIHVTHMYPQSPHYTFGGTVLKESDDLDILRVTFAS